MAISSSQESAFSGGTFGLTMGDFQLAILILMYSVLYLWAAWAIYTQWIAWSRGSIAIYDLLVRSVRCALVTLLASFLLL